MPIDGSAATQLAERATRFMTDSDGRLIGPLDAGARWLSSLVVIDTETRAEARIDEGVHFHSIDASRVNEEGIVSYSVADGERSGVYLVRLPSSERSGESRATQPRRDITLDLVRDRDGRPVPRPRWLNNRPSASE